MPNSYQPDKSIKDTGERMVPAYHKGHIVYGEHIVRYRAAANLVKGKVVLDIASGSGYGCDVLCKTAKKVYGVDIDSDAVAYAQKNYQADNTEFIEGSGTKIPLEDASVDVVVSFETIEHIEKYDLFMQEVLRVLKPEGLLILSTPNDVEFPEDNHYHVHEFEEAELLKLVKRYFKNTKQYYQATWLYNALVDKDKLGSEWESNIQTLQTAPVTPEKSIYFYMLCSNRALSETVMPLAAISEHWSARTLQENEKGLRKHIEDQGAMIQHLDNERHRLLGENQAYKAKLEETSTRSTLSRIKNRLKKK